MPTYYEYHVTVDQGNGTTQTYIVDVHEDHHDAHGFDGNGNLKDASSISTIVANALQIVVTAVKELAHYGVTKKR
jgi:hypothetical protein